MTPSNLRSECVDCLEGSRCSVEGMAEPDRQAEWWTTTDVAAYLGVSVGTVSTYRARGQMPEPDQTVGRTHLWRPARIVDWHDARPGHGGRPAC